jgi:hypothetical protein
MRKGNYFYESSGEGSSQKEKHPKMELCENLVSSLSESRETLLINPKSEIEDCNRATHRRRWTAGAWCQRH